MPAAIGEQNWTGALFAQTELLRIFSKLETGELSIPGGHKTVAVPTCRLDSIGALGPDRKRIHEGFKVTTDDWTPYPAFWGHESAKVRTIDQVPNAHLAVWLESPRGPNYGPHLWERAGRILLVERLWPISHRVLAVGFDTKILGNTWWALKSELLSPDQEKALLLWLNSSLAIVQYFGRRVVTRSAWMQMKQPAWASMPVLDVRGLKTQQLHALVTAYDSISHQALEPIARVKTDPIRGQIDAAISSVLGLSGVSSIRELLDREPGLNATDIAPRDVMTTEEEEDHT